MTLENLNFILLLPRFMREDETCIALSKVIDNMTDDLMKTIKLLSVWDRIDFMTDDELDRLAGELNIEWYSNSFFPDAKREIIKMADMISSKCGTDYAVQYVLRVYFGGVSIKNWYEYDGEPYHYKIIADNPYLINSSSELFERILRTVARKSVILDSIETATDGTTTNYISVASYEAKRRIRR